jgi:hypothetical protein
VRELKSGVYTSESMSLMEQSWSNRARLASSMEVFLVHRRAIKLVSQKRLYEKRAPTGVVIEPYRPF